MAAEGKTVMLTLPQLAKRVGIEYRTAHNWVDRGLLAPSILASTGAGHPNYFSGDDLRKAEAFAALRRAGVSVEAMERGDVEALATAVQLWRLVRRG